MREDQYLYRKVQDAFKSVLADSSLDARIEEARAHIATINDGHHGEETPNELADAISAFKACSRDTSAEEAAGLLLDVFMAATRPR